MSSALSNHSKPVNFLAFANEQEGRRYLRNLPAELGELQEILEVAERKKLCKLVVRSNATLDGINKVFIEHGRNVAIFHYAGHTGPEGLLLESTSGEARLAHAEGLARFLGRQGSLQLVVLNGCSTRPQVAELLESGVPSVVATARPIVDEVAREFAVTFYSQLAAGRNLRDAFELARERVKAGRGTNPRDLVAVAAFAAEEIADDRGFPWELRTRPGAERAERLSLPELAGDPLFGLPELKEGQWLPPSPYRHLQRFTRNEAAVFFGRGHAIRALYDLTASPSSRPVILYSGPTGVGKSSVLDAGLTPRLETTHEVLYLRRDGLLGLLSTLLHGLSCDPDVRTTDLNHLWLEREQTTGRPLVVVLDQAEEAFTRPWGSSPAQEVAELVGAVRGLFADPARAPRGKLIL
ncbi:MAG: CHAT domain-containing protein, partial [Planctomycetaceae bacterium]|nr:CHAT domain-containing protein [Planctomycetaceae bacterium]